MNSNPNLAYEVGQVAFASISMIILMITIVKCLLCAIRPNTFQSVYTLVLFFNVFLISAIGLWNYRAVQFYFFGVKGSDLFLSGYIMAFFLFLASVLMLLMLINNRFVRMLFKQLKNLVEEK